MLLLLRSTVPAAAYLDIVIGSTTCNSLIVKSSIQIENVLNDAPDTCSFLVRQQTPSEGQPVTIKFYGTTIFAGHVINTERAPRRRGQSRLRTQVDAVDFSWLLDRRSAYIRFEDSKPSSICVNLIGSFTSGFTTSNVTTNSLATLHLFIAEYEPVSKALTRLAQDSAMHWYVDYSKDIHFFATETTAAPTTLTNTSAVPFWDFSRAVDLSQVRNRVSCVGMPIALTEPALPTNIILAVDDTSPFNAAGGTVVGAGWQQITYGGRSINSGPGNLTGVPASGAGAITQMMGAGEQVRGLYTAINSNACNSLASLEGGDGIHEAFITDDTADASAGAARASAELTLFAQPIESVRYTTVDTLSVAGKTIGVTISSPSNVSGTYLIQRVSIDGWERGANLGPLYHVEASSQRYTLEDLLRDVATR